MIQPGDLEKSIGIAVLVVIAIYAAATIGCVLGVAIWNTVRSTKRAIEDYEEFESHVDQRITNGARFQPKLIGPPHRIMRAG